MAVVTETLNIALRGEEHAFPVLSLVDRRKRPARRKQFALTRGIERLLYGVTGRSTGAWAAHLDKHDHEEAVLVADKATVQEGVLTQAELDAGADPPAQSRTPPPPFARALTVLPSLAPRRDGPARTVLGAMRGLVDLEARGRVRRASLLPLNVAVAAVTELGRSDASSALLTALHKMPRKWQLEAQAEEDRGNLQVDLVAQAELEALEEQCDELADVDLAVELLTTPPPHAESVEDAQRTSNMQLAPVPAAVEQQLGAYAAFRQQPFNRHRATGGSVESTTVESDRANALWAERPRTAAGTSPTARLSLAPPVRARRACPPNEKRRWLGYVKAEHGQAPSLKLFAHERVGEWTEAWVLKLRSLGCKASTVSVYVNGVISVSTYALQLVPEPELCPTEELLTLRCAAQARKPRACWENPPM